MTTKKAARGEVKAAILDLLKMSPSGKSGRQVAAALDRSTDQMLTRLAELQHQGKVTVGYVDVNRRRQKVWFHPDHAASAAELSPAEWGARKATTVARALAPKSARTASTGGPVVTKAPPFVDRRFTPERVEPFFSAMTPGSYIRTGSAIERAYGGGK